MADTRLGKIGITVKEPWSENISYEVLDMSLFAVENGGDGCSYVALRNNIGVTPGTDPTTWVKSTQAGQSIYDLAVKYHHFVGTEEEFEAEYQAALQAARDAAAGASAVEAQVEAAETARVAAENARVSAESARASAETGRESAESARQTAEAGRSSAEAGRDSAETARVTAEQGRASAESDRVSAEAARTAAEADRVSDFSALKTDMETAIGQADAATAAAVATNNQIQTAETGRVSAEQGRVSAETARASAESARATAESGRATAEAARVTAEGQRATAEGQRVTAENARVSAESGRDTAESARVTAEAARVSAETARESQAASDHTRAESDHEQAVEDHDEIAAKANTADLLDGTLVPALSGDLEPWAGGSSPVSDTFYDAVRTTAGSKSVISSAGADILRVVARTDFYAQALRFTGKNLLRDAVAVGAGYYILVPALPFGTYGTAVQPNGVLFVNSNGENLKPTVYFKPLANGAPTSVNDGSACPYTDSNGLRFYNPSQPGFLVISGITLASTCARVAWSGNGFPYNKYVAVNDASDAGFSFAMATVIHAIHTYDLMLAVGSKGDYFEYVSAMQVKWYRVNDRVQPAWTTTNNGDGTYTHSATITGMASGGSAECGSLNLGIEGTTVSYTDENESATTDYVRYNLATVVTGTVDTPTHGAIEDFGLDKLTQVEGSAYITVQYVQSYEAATRALVDGKISEANLVVAEALNNLDARVSAIESNRGKSASYKAKVMDADELTRYDLPRELWGEGVPSASVIPSNWPAGVPWDGIPAFKGQIYNDTTNKKVYKAFGNTAVSDWVLLN